MRLFAIPEKLRLSGAGVDAKLITRIRNESAPPALMIADVRTGHEVSIEVRPGDLPGRL